MTSVLHKPPCLRASLHYTPSYFELLPADWILLFLYIKKTFLPETDAKLEHKKHWNEAFDAQTLFDPHLTCMSSRNVETNLQPWQSHLFDHFRCDILPFSISDWKDLHIHSLFPFLILLYFLSSCPFSFNSSLNRSIDGFRDLLFAHIQ